MQLKATVLIGGECSQITAKAAGAGKEGGTYPASISLQSIEVMAEVF